MSGLAVKVFAAICNSLRIRRQRGTRKGFFQDILALTKYLLFDGWKNLLHFMLDDSPASLAKDTS